MQFLQIRCVRGARAVQILNYTRSSSHCSFGGIFRESRLKSPVLTLRNVRTALDRIMGINLCFSTAFFDISTIFYDG